jgi:citrate lyase subunit beta/citryl-CoA lyase
MNAPSIEHRRPPALRRSWLFVPGMAGDAQQAGLDSGADVLVADLEEFTAAADRPAARRRIVELMAQCRARQMVGAVRVNLLDGDGPDDVRGMMAGAPDAIFLPHVVCAAQIHALDALIGAAETEFGLPAGHVEIVPTLESARGLVNTLDILEASPRVTACLLAAEDLSADLLVERSPDGLALQHVRAQFHVHCRAAGRVGIDCPFGYRDPAAFDAELTWARRIGLQAKCVVLPQQVAAVHAAFTPSGARLEEARERVRRFDAVRRGEAVDGVPVDGPDYHSARRLLARRDDFDHWAARSASPVSTKKTS